MKKTIAIVGEAFGEDEERLGLPFVGKAGWMLDKMLVEAEIDRRDCYVTTVFHLRPKPTNDIVNLTQKDRPSDLLSFEGTPLPALAKSQWLRPEFYPEVQRLWRDLRELAPNLVIAMGGTAAWALLGDNKIAKVRGTVSESFLGLKTLPTYHPNAVVRQWNLRPVTILDLMKAKRQASFPEVRRPRREIWLEPTLAHLELFYENYIRPAREIAFDIETAGKDSITCVGFAPSPRLAIVIPFVDNRQADGSYWRTPAEEVAAWRYVAKYLAHPALKIGQNTLYDINWLWTFPRITPRNYDADTMLMHHAMQPESQKGLGFLGSVYTDEPAWKTMRNKGMFTTKRGE